MQRNKERVLSQDNNYIASIAEETALAEAGTAGLGINRKQASAGIPHYFNI